MSWRDLGAGEVRPDHVGQRLQLAGWVATRRDHGGLVFIDLRDQTGICQLVVNPERAAEAATAAREIRSEFVLQAEGQYGATPDYYKVVAGCPASARRRGWPESRSARRRAREVLPA